MAALIRKSFNTPEETRPFKDGTGYLAIVNLEQGPVVQPPSGCPSLRLTAAAVLHAATKKLSVIMARARLVPTP